jgi:hypothetical protein
MRQPIDLPDVDLEVVRRDEVAGLFGTAVPASQITNNRLVRHNTGLYFQDIPVNPLTGLAAFPYKLAEELGFLKIDLLSAPYPYEGVDSMDELRALLVEPIDWSWFKVPEFVATLFQFDGMVNADLTVGEVVAYYEPQSIDDLACLVAIIRPGKKHLIGEPWETVRAQIWDKEGRGHQFKKSHAVAYALAVGIDARLKSPDFFQVCGFF